MLGCAVLDSGGLCHDLLGSVGLCRAVLCCGLEVWLGQVMAAYREAWPPPDLAWPPPDLVAPPAVASIVHDSRRTARQAERHGHRRLGLANSDLLFRSQRDVVACDVTHVVVARSICSTTPPPPPLLFRSQRDVVAHTHTHKPRSQI